MDDEGLPPQHDCADHYSASQKCKTALTDYVGTHVRYRYEPYTPSSHIPWHKDPMWRKYWDLRYIEPKGARNDAPRGVESKATNISARQRSHHQLLNDDDNISAAMPSFSHNNHVNPARLKVAPDLTTPASVTSAQDYEHTIAEIQGDLEVEAYEEEDLQKSMRSHLTLKTGYALPATGTTSLPSMHSEYSTLPNASAPVSEGIKLSHGSSKVYDLHEDTASTDRPPVVSAASLDAATAATAGPAVPAAPEFPPGQKLPGFVALGKGGVASEHQGNVANINKDLRRQIVFAERNCVPRLTWPQIAAKYSNWTISEPTMRGLDRTMRLSPERRSRDIAWTYEAIKALKSGVVKHTHQHKTAWAKVSQHILEESDKTISMAQAKAKWGQLVELQGRLSDAILEPVRPMAQKRRLASKEIATSHKKEDKDDNGDEDQEM